MMNDEQKMIFEMLKAKEITAEEAERLMNAVNVPVRAGIAPSRVRVLVTERGQQKVNVKVPFAVVRVALKLCRGLGVTVGGSEGAQLAEVLKQVDLDEILRQLGDGEIALPCTLLDLDVEAEDSVNVQVVLE